MLRRYCLALLMLVPCARAVELHIQFGALERMLGEQVFTQEGRRYVKGDRAAPCNFAYLEAPHIDDEDGRLRIRAKFTGRSALNVLGQCVGMGDAFIVIVTARPYYQEGQLRLGDVSAAPDGKTGFYIRRVCAALAGSLGRDFGFPVEKEAHKLLEEAGRRELRGFKVPEIRVEPDALVLVVDFELRVK